MERILRNQLIFTTYIWVTKMNTNHTLGIICLTILVSACGKSTSGHNHPSKDTAPETVTGVWPPLLDGIENVQLLQGSALAGARESVVDAMRASVLNNPQVKQALGSNYREFEASLSDAKSDSSAAFLFYNYDENTTVEATFSNDGTVQLNTTPAATFQPAEHAEEIPQAIALARGTLVNDGYDLNGLVGTAILAFPPSNQIENAEESFYDQRILYVTFGLGNGELPDYSALVNLSVASVSDAKLVN